ncbi:retrovirus-related pol polyprotein from transposon TNT 1-94 [Tanacetum coccineum]
MYKVHTKPNQTRITRLPQDIRKTNKRVSFSTGVIPTTSVSRPQPKSNQLEDRVMSNNSQGKKQEVEDHRRNLKFSNNKTSVTACNDSLNAKTSNVSFVCVACGKCVLNENHDLCDLHYINDVNSRTRQPMAVPISTREPKHNVNQSVATSSKKTVATDSTIKKSRHITKKLYEQKSSLNGKKYVLVIVDDYSRYTWTHFLRSKDETPGVLIDFLTLVQRGLHAQVITVRTDKGTEFLNKTLHAYFAKEGIRHETSTARTPEQNGYVNRPIATTIVFKSKLFHIVIPRHEKTPYHIINARKPSVKFFHIFGSLCYIVRDGENLDKMKEKGDACILLGMSYSGKGFIDHVSSDLSPQCSTMVLEQDSLSPDPQSQENVSQCDSHNVK